MAAPSRTCTDTCDTPAAHQTGGFGSYLRNTFCTHRKVQKEDLQKLEIYGPEGEFFLCSTIYIMGSLILAFPVVRCVVVEPMCDTRYEFLASQVAR